MAFFVRLQRGIIFEWFVDQLTSLKSTKIIQVTPIDTCILIFHQFEFVMNSLVLERKIGMIAYVAWNISNIVFLFKLVVKELNQLLIRFRLFRLFSVIYGPNNHITLSKLGFLVSVTVKRWNGKRSKTNLIFFKGKIWIENVNLISILLFFISTLAYLSSS